MMADEHDGGENDGSFAAEQALALYRTLTESNHSTVVKQECTSDIQGTVGDLWRRPRLTEPVQCEAVQCEAVQCTRSWKAVQCV